MTARLNNVFFQQEVLIVAKELLGKKIVRIHNNGEKKEYIITETEAYFGEQDLACHASKGRTKRTEALYHEGGVIYVYLIYGIHWILNFVTGKKDEPQGVMIRNLQGCKGPGRVGKLLELDKTFYGENLAASSRIWVKPSHINTFKILAKPRIGIDYAGDIWKNKPWRFLLE